MLLSIALSAFAQDTTETETKVPGLWAYVLGNESLKFWPDAATAVGATDDCGKVSVFLANALGANHVTSYCSVTYSEFFSNFPVGIPAGDTLMIVWIGVGTGGQLLTLDTSSGSSTGVNMELLGGFLENTYKDHPIRVITLLDAHRAGELAPGLALRGPIAAETPSTVTVALSATNGVKPAPPGAFAEAIVQCMGGAAKDQNKNHSLGTDELADCLMSGMWAHGEVSVNTKISATFDLMPYEQSAASPTTSDSVVDAQHKPVLSRPTRRVLGGVSLATGIGLSVGSFLAYNAAHGRVDDLSNPTASFASEQDFNLAREGYSRNRTLAYVLGGSAAPLLIGGGVLIVF